MKIEWSNHGKMHLYFELFFCFIEARQCCWMTIIFGIYVQCWKRTLSVCAFVRETRSNLWDNVVSMVTSSILIGKFSITYFGNESFRQSQHIDLRFYSIFGHKVNTCIPGTKPINGMYPACKFALTALTECLRQEVSYVEMGIKVTVSKKRQLHSLFYLFSFVLLHFSSTITIISIN